MNNIKKIHYYKIIVLSLLLLIGYGTVTLAVELVPDGSFENFDDTWQCDLNCINPVNYYFIFSSSAYDEITYAYLFHDAGIYQDLTIPSDATTLSLWYDNQPDDNVPEDGSFTVYLLDPINNDIYTQHLYDTQSDSWINGTLTIPTNLQGQSVRLYISNTTGYNRIDYLQFKTAADQLAELQQIYPTVKLHVLSTTGKAIKNATVFVKQNGVRQNLITTKTLTAGTKVTTNKKGYTAKFMIAQTLAAGETVKVCAKKNFITECATVAPETGVETSYDFSFASKKVK